MDALPFILGGVGFLILTVIGVVYYLNERFKKSLIRLAVEQLQQHATPTQILPQLKNQGLDDGQAGKILALAQRRLQVQEALQWLQQGKTEDEAKAQLLSTGMQPDQADDVLGSALFHHFCLKRPVLSMLLGIILPLLGLACITGGLFLWIGNKSGRFVTFPYAGQLVIGVGVTMFAMGAKVLLKTMQG